MATDPLARAFELLRQGQHAALLSELDTLPTLPPAQAGRAWAWRALAYERLERLPDARTAIMEAIRAAKAAGDQDALPSLRDVHTRISAGLAALDHARQQAAQDARLTSRPTPELLAEDPELAVRQAGAWIDQGELENAHTTLDLLLSQTLAPRPAVLTRLMRARLASTQQEPCERWILDAWKIADHADDQGLIVACARAAKMANVTIPSPQML